MTDKAPIIVALAPSAPHGTLTWRTNCALRHTSTSKLYIPRLTPTLAARTSPLDFRPALCTLPTRALLPLLPPPLLSQYRSRRRREPTLARDHPPSATSQMPCLSTRWPTKICRWTPNLLTSIDVCVALSFLPAHPFELLGFSLATLPSGSTLLAARRLCFVFLCGPTLINLTLLMPFYLTARPWYATRKPGDTLDKYCLPGRDERTWKSPSITWMIYSCILVAQRGRLHSPRLFNCTLFCSSRSSLLFFLPAFER